jgi:hypothetical protein
MTNSGMATTYKLFNGSANDGATYIDLPISGRLVSVAFAIHLTAGGGGIAYILPEVSRVAINQNSVSNPRGVIAQAACTTGAASTGSAQNAVQYPDEPVKSGERLYLNCAAAANYAVAYVQCFLTIA